MNSNLLDHSYHLIHDHNCGHVVFLTFNYLFFNKFSYRQLYHPRLTIVIQWILFFLNLGGYKKNER